MGEMGLDVVEGYCNVNLAIKIHLTVKVAEEGAFLALLAP